MRMQPHSPTLLGGQQYGAPRRPDGYATPPEGEDADDEALMDEKAAAFLFAPKEVAVWEAKPKTDMYAAYQRDRTRGAVRRGAARL